MSDSTRRELERKIDDLELKLNRLALQLENGIVCPHCKHFTPSKCEWCDELISFCPMCGKRLRKRSPQLAGAAGRYAHEGGTGGGRPRN